MSRKDFLKKTLKIALSQRLENVRDLNQVDNRLEIDPNVTDTESQTCKPCKEALRDLGYSATCAGFRQLEEDKRNFKKSCIHTGSEDDDFSLCKMAWEKAMEEIYAICKAAPGSLSCCDGVSVFDNPKDYALFMAQRFGDFCRGPNGVSPEGSTDCLDILREKYMEYNCPQCHSDIVTQCQIEYWERETPWGNGYRGCSQVLSSELCCGRPKRPYENIRN